MLLEVTLVYLFATFGESRPQGGSTDRPQPNRPFYRPNPTYELISQLIPSGEPWPANVGDYGMFSQTKPPNYTPLWATNPATAPTTTTTKTTITTTTTTEPPTKTTTTEPLSTSLEPTPSPAINVEERFRETERPIESGWLWPGEELNVAYAKPLSAVEPIQPKMETGVLFTSAPAMLHMRIDDDEPKLANVFPANLIPENDVVESSPTTEVTTKFTSQKHKNLFPKEQMEYQMEQLLPAFSIIDEFSKK